MASGNRRTKNAPSPRPNRATPPRQPTPSSTRQPPADPQREEPRSSWLRRWWNGERLRDRYEFLELDDDDDLDDDVTDDDDAGDSDDEDDEDEVEEPEDQQQEKAGDVGSGPAAARNVTPVIDAKALRHLSNEATAQQSVDSVDDDNRSRPATASRTPTTNQRPPVRAPRWRASTKTAADSPLLGVREEDRAGVPARYDDGVQWLGNGLRRQGWASFLGLIFGWTGTWLALWGSVVGFIVGIFIALGVITSTSAGSDLFNLGAGNAVTFVGVLTGGVFGIAGGFLTVLKVLYVDHPVQLVGALVSGAIITAVIVVVTAAYERLGLRIRGYRRLSNDEVRRIAPLVKDVADAMDLPALPRFAMHDVVIPNAWSQMRTIVITKGLLQSLDDGELRAILAHELQHWQSGDSVALHFVWAATFPAVLLYNFGTWLAGSWPTGGQVARAARTVLSILGWLIAWPSWVLIRLVLVPVVSLHQRAYEYEADQAAARIGLASELVSALRKLTAFEGGRTGWEAALSATHPPTELRIERLQPPRPDDWEYQEHELHGPSWQEFRRIFGGLRGVVKR